MGTLFNRTFGPGNNPQVPTTNIPLNGGPMHVTQFDPQLNRRVSWDTNGVSGGVSGLHPTNHNLPKGHPQRHTW